MTERLLHEMKYIGLSLNGKKALFLRCFPNDEYSSINVIQISNRFIKILDEDYNSNIDKKLAGFYEEKINSYCIIYWDPVTGERDNPNYFKSILLLFLYYIKILHNILMIK